MWHPPKSQSGHREHIILWKPPSLTAVWGAWACYQGAHYIVEALPLYGMPGLAILHKKHNPNGIHGHRVNVICVILLSRATVGSNLFVLQYVWLDREQRGREPQTKLRRVDSIACGRADSYFMFSYNEPTWQKNIVSLL